MSESTYKFPIAPVQSALFFLNQIHPESLAYNIPLCVRLEGELDKEALQQALDYLVQRHEILRTTYNFDDDGPIQIVQADGQCPLSIENVAAQSGSDIESALNGWLQTRFCKNFDLFNGPVIYVDLAVLSEYDHCLLITFHHITVDHNAIGLYTRQLEHAYRRFSQKTDMDLPDQELQYADYVVWLKENTSEQELAPKVEIWKKRLEGFSGLINLPLDRPRPAFSSSKGAQYLFDLTTEQSAAVKKFSSEKSVSLYLSFLSMFKVLLHKKCQQDDIIVATPFANRGDQEELDNVMGCFINTLPLATDFKKITDFDSLLNVVKEAMLEAYDNQTVPFEAIVDAVNPSRDHSYNPIFQVGFVFQEPPTDVNLAGLKCTTIPLHSGGSMYDLHFWMWERHSKVSGLVWYNTDVYDEQSVAALVDQYKKVIDWVMGNAPKDVRLAEI